MNTVTVEAALPATPLSGATLAAALGRPRVPGLDFLRAIAVLLVLINHSGLYKIGPLAVFDGGFGVEMFFVLSGFLITGLLLDELDKTGGIRLGSFYRRRAARLLPAFYAYLLIGLAYRLWRDSPIPWGAIVASALYVLNYYEIVVGTESRYVFHCWSLAVEEQFYLLWPLALLFVVRRGWSISKSLVVLVVAVWLLRPLLIVAFGVGDVYLYRALETRADQLGVGCLLAVVVRTVQWRAFFERLASRVWLVLALLAGLIASLTLFRGTLLFQYGLGYTLEPVLVALLIPVVILAASGTGWMARLLNARVPVLIGQISYGMYLFHPVLMDPARHFFLRFMPGATPLAVIFSISVVFVVAYFSFRFFEQPLRQRLRGS